MDQLLVIAYTLILPFTFAAVGYDLPFQGTYGLLEGQEKQLTEGDRSKGRLTGLGAGLLS